MVTGTAPTMEALTALYAANRRQLVRAALRILDSQELAEDVVQDAYVKLLEGAVPQGVCEPAAYLYQTVRHLAIDCHRRRALEQRLFADEEAGRHAVSASLAEDAAVSSQALRMASAALTQMSARTRRAFELHRFEGCTQRDVARELGVSTALVNFMIRDAHLALSSCHECLQPD
ncbi:RNA polymerase sigma factor, sigma-70 family protein 7 [Achromobacter xylosoxidans A8]|uniref:RNA polymerase sigma factor, sigma-70 family protein 7 n=1 Tax=Achromobacter xylosoxidans (strain A8) TaxID=762376 RepID=E3HNK5_ACHXA|nr:sigma-70 family RNA polymerase sigma factor [Achromobacter xylosoxidans]ADP17044.1 RNA polymerase sigma factor, sigma-70 family protein 7 [Achromobacter xylosoxidans A8]